MMMVNQSIFINTVATAYGKPIFYGPTIEGKIAYEFTKMLEKNHRSPQEIETYAKSLLPTLIATRSKRYRPYYETHNASKQVFQEIFEQAYKKDPETIILAAETYQNHHFYPFTATILSIKTPQLVGKCIGNPLMKIALSIYCCVKGFQFCRYVLFPFFQTHVIPHIVYWTPTFVAKAASFLITAQTVVVWIAIAIVITKLITRYFPEIPIVSPALRSIQLRFSDFKFPEDPFSFAIVKSMEAMIFIFRTCTNVQATCNFIAKQAETKRARICKPQVTAAWNQMMQELVQSCQT